MQHTYTKFLILCTTDSFNSVAKQPPCPKVKVARKRSFLLVRKFHNHVKENIFLVLICRRKYYSYITFSVLELRVLREKFNTLLKSHFALTSPTLGGSQFSFMFYVCYQDTLSLQGQLPEVIPLQIIYSRMQLPLAGIL